MQRVCQLGDVMFADAVPAGQSAKDAYVMRVVLHDWNDKETTMILKNVRAAIGELTTCLYTGYNARLAFHSSGFAPNPR